MKIPSLNGTEMFRLALPATGSFRTATKPLLQTKEKKKKKALPTLGEAISIQGGFLEKGHLSFFRIEQLLSQLQVGKRLLVPGWPGLLIGP